MSWGEAFADPDVALDEILSLTGNAEPAVLRVVATGGSARGRAKLAGDWLCAADGGSPRRLPFAAWKYGRESEAWSSGRTWLDAWEECEDARWMLHAAVTIGVDRRLVVLAACACARTALRFAPEDEHRPRRAIETAEAWARGKATEQDLRDAAVSAYASASAAAEADGAAYAAAYAAEAAAGTYAAAYAAEAAASYNEDRSSGLRDMSNIVREKVPTLAVLRAAAGATRSGPKRHADARRT